MAKQIYTADRYNRMHHPDCAEREYVVEVDGARYHVEAASQRGAEIKARAHHEARMDAEQGGRR